MTVNFLIINLLSFISEHGLSMPIYLFLIVGWLFLLPSQLNNKNELDMKKRTILCVAMIALLSLPCFAKRPIKLDGRWMKEERSAIPVLPIQAWVEDDNKSLLLEFSGNLGTVLVTVTNDSGEVVYNQAIQTGLMFSSIICLQDELDKGFVISITDGQNKVYGKISNY